MATEDRDVSPRKGKGKRKRRGETSMRGCLSRAPHWGLGLQPRLSAEDQNIYNSVKKTAGMLFKKYKVDISGAIKATFPFLELLRDRGFITSEKYKESQEHSTEQISVQALIYNILSDLEKTFDLPLLDALFSKAIVKKYPALNDICKTFKNEIPNIKNFLESDADENEGRSDIQLSLEQGLGENSYLSLPWSSSYPLNHKGTAASDSGHSEQVSKTEEIDVMVDTTTDNNDALESQQVNVEHAQQSDPAGSKKHREEYVDFHSEILPVTCGKMKGMLYKNKLEEGPKAECIETEDGKWVTPRDFVLAGGYQKPSNWKNTVRCGGKTLKQLMEEEKLPIPPRKYGKKKKLKKPDVCKICQDGENLLCCDTCSRFFHGHCHLPPVQTERPLRRPWSCTFCRMKECSGSQQCRRESEVLARPMGPEEQLKCEFLLLEIYCHSDSISLEQIQQDEYRKETYQCMDNFMMLNKIKKNLSERCYPNVEGFMKDMRLIFQNHRAFNKNHALYLMGINLEVEFEQNFKKVFAIQEIKQEPIDNKLKLEDNA